MSVFDEINTLTAEQVLSVLNLPLANDGKSYVCPMCGNGEHGNPKDGHGDGIRPRKNQKGQVKWHCFGACAKDYSNFDLAAASLGLDAERDTAESARRVGELFGLSVKGISSSSREKNSARSSFDDKEFKVMIEKKLASDAEPKDKEPKNYAKLYEYCRSNVAKFLADNGGSFRGLTAATFEKYGLGVHPDFGVEGHEKRPHLIIPYDDNHFFARAIEGHERSQHGQNAPLYEPCPISTKYLNFLFEGELNALSFAQADGAAFNLGVLATGGASKYKKVVPELEKRFGTSEHKPCFVVVFDNDETGMKNSPLLVDELLAAGYPATAFFFEGRQAGKEYEIHKSDGTIEKITVAKVDANDLLIEGKLSRVVFDAYDSLDEKLDAAREKIKETSEKMKLADADKLQAAICAAGLEISSFSEYFSKDFLADVERAEKYSERKTGFDNLDTAQIFMPGLYALGALPATGKTTFAWQLCEQLARRGEFCLYVTYEQSRYELYRKSLARELFKRNAGKSRNELEDVAASFAATSFNLRVLSLSSDIGVDVLIEKLKPIISAANQPPVICFDYLQIIPPSKGVKASASTKERVDDAVRRLKDFQLSTDATLIAISSFNRENYYQAASFSSFKESGGIEYTADVVWALQNGGECDEIDKETITKLAKEKIRPVRLTCLKNRSGGLYECFFRYHAAHDYFESIPLEGEKERSRSERPKRER